MGVYQLLPATHFQISSLRPPHYMHCVRYVPSEQAKASRQPQSTTHTLKETYLAMCILQIGVCVL